MDTRFVHSAACRTPAPLIPGETVTADYDSKVVEVYFYLGLKRMRHIPCATLGARSSTAGTAHVTLLDDQACRPGTGNLAIAAMVLSLLARGCLKGARRGEVAQSTNFVWAFTAAWSNLRAEQTLEAP
jgi:hypothetical protein